MKRSGVLLLCLCLLGAAGCSDDGPTNPSNLPIVMTASLSPSNEVPAIASPENTWAQALWASANKSLLAGVMGHSPIVQRSPPDCGEASHSPLPAGWLVQPAGIR